MVLNIAKEKKHFITDTLVILCAMKVAKPVYSKGAHLNIAQPIIKLYFMTLRRHTETSSGTNREKSEY
jgi:hypothetical protein